MKEKIKKLIEYGSVVGDLINDGDLLESAGHEYKWCKVRYEFKDNFVKQSVWVDAKDVSNSCKNGFTQFDLWEDFEDWQLEYFIDLAENKNTGKSMREYDPSVSKVYFTYCGAMVNVRVYEDDTIINCGVDYENGEKPKLVNRQDWEWAVLKNAVSSLNSIRNDIEYAIENLSSRINEVNRGVSD